MKQVQLRPQQEALVHTIVGRPKPVRHLLIAPTGSGKTTTMIEAIRRLSESDHDFRVLVIFDSDVEGQNFLARAADVAGLAHTIVSKRWLRAASASTRAQPWPTHSIVGVAARDLRDDWARRPLGRSGWSLVVVDDATDAPWLEKWLAGMSATRIVMLASAPRRVPPAGGEWSVSHWPNELFESGGRDIERISVAFARSSAEETLGRLADQAVAIAEDFPEWGAAEITHAARSSPFALQAAALRVADRLRPMRNSLTHGRTGQDEGSGIRKGTLSSLVAFFAALERVIAAVDQLDVDERFQRFFELVIDRLTPDGEPFIVFTRERRTADYLVDRLRFMQRDVEAIEPGTVMPEELPRRAVAYVVADDSLAGLDLGQFSRAVFYDDPEESASEREARLSRAKSLLIFELVETAALDAAAR